MQIWQYVVLAVTYIGLGLGYLPGLRMNRATIAFVGAACLVGLSINLKEAWEAIDAGTIVFLPITRPKPLFSNMGM